MPLGRRALIDADVLVLLSYEFLLAKEEGGGRLRNGRGEEFVGQAQARDSLSRVILEEIARGRGTQHGGVFLDVRVSSAQLKKERGAALREWMPGMFKRLCALGCDPRDTMIETHPGAHYCLGGLRVDAEARTSVRGLFAAGEVAGNVHGANRLAGNGLSEALVFGAIAGREAARHGLHSRPAGDGVTAPVKDAEARLGRMTSQAHGPSPLVLRRRIQDVVWEKVGPVREASGLLDGAASLERLREDCRSASIEPIRGYSRQLQDAIEAERMAHLGWLVAQFAHRRTETRGHHYRSDYPNPGPGAASHLIAHKAASGNAKPVIHQAPAEFT